MTHATKHPRRMALPAAAITALLLAGCSSGNVGESWQCPLADAGTCDSVAAADPAVPDADAARNTILAEPLWRGRNTRPPSPRGRCTLRRRLRRRVRSLRLAGAAVRGRGRTTRGRPIGRRNRSPRNPRRLPLRQRFRRPTSFRLNRAPPPFRANLPPAPLPDEPESPGLLAGGENSPGDHDDLRTDEVVARIWIAPFIDAEGVYREGVLGPRGAGAGRLEARAVKRLLELFEGPEAPGPWSPPSTPAALHALLPWRAFDESSETYVNAASAGFVIELPPFAGIDGRDSGRACGHAGRRRAPSAAPSRSSIGRAQGSARPPAPGPSPAVMPAARARAHGHGSPRVARFGRLAAPPCGRPALHALGLPGVRHRLPRGRSRSGHRDGARRFPAGRWRARWRPPGRRTRRLEPDALLSLAAELVAPDTGGYRDGGSERPRRRWAPRDPLHEQCIAPGRALSVHPTGLAFHHPDGGSGDIAVRVLSAIAFPEVWPGWRGNALLGDFHRDFPATGLPGADLPHRHDGGRGCRREGVPEERAGPPQQAGTGIARYLPGLPEKARDWQAVTERIKDGEKLVRACYMAAVYAPLDALDEAEQAVRAIYHGQGWRVNAERYMQLPSWLACLPMASAGGLDADLERMGRMKTLLTSSAVNLAPLHGEWRGQPGQPGQPAGALPDRAPGPTGLLVALRQRGRQLQRGGDGEIGLRQGRC